MTRTETLMEVFAEREQQEEYMAFRNPWVPLFWNWVVAVTIIALFFSFAKWGWDLRTERRDSALRAQAVEAYKTEQKAAQESEEAQAKKKQEEREAFLKAEVDAVLPVIGKLATDEQKETELGVMIARHMNGMYPDSFQEIAAQPEQWPLYDGTDNTYCDETDRPLAEKILLPYLESGAIPRGLTKDMIHASWSPTDLVARNTWEFTSKTETWRYGG